MIHRIVYLAVNHRSDGCSEIGIGRSDLPVRCQGMLQGVHISGAEDLAFKIYIYNMYR